MHIKLILFIFMTRMYSKSFIKHYLLIINIYKIVLCNKILLNYHTVHSNFRLLGSIDTRKCKLTQLIGRIFSTDFRLINNILSYYQC